MIESCLDVFDLRRAAEWTEALNGWCTGQPDLVPYRGQCLVHRAQILQAHGAWDEAVTEAERARLILSDPVHPALGLALYQLGELYRLRGEPADAERAYRAALEHGREPAPGMALVRLAEGKVAVAAAAVRRMLQESGVPATECAVRAAAVEILLAAGDLAGARSAADELVRTADRMGAHLLHASTTPPSVRALQSGGAASAAAFGGSCPGAALRRRQPRISRAAHIRNTARSSA